MIAVTCGYAILHIAIVIPIQFLAGKCHKFNNWSCRKHGWALDLLQTALQKIVKDGSKFLEDSFIMIIFDRNKYFLIF